MIWYKFHLGDYITHTLHLSDAEDLAYRRLLDLYYMSEKPIPLDTDAVSRKIRLDLDITEAVLNEFFERTDEGYRNGRCDAEIERYQAQVAHNKRAAESASAKRKANVAPKRHQSGTQTDTDTDKDKEKTISSQATRFGDFWSAWPTSKRKVGKGACESKWLRLGLDPLADQIIASVTRLKGSEQWLSGFEPAPLTYLNQKRWEDESGAEAVPNRRLV